MAEPTTPTGPRCGAPGSSTRFRLSGVPKKDGGGRRAPNRYAGTCVACGHRVATGAGCVSKGTDGRWVIFC